MSTAYDRLKRFEAALAKRLPGFAIEYKDESTLMKIIGAIMFFNKAFMTGFVTTIGYKVYFPTRTAVESMRGNGRIGTLAHEYRHAKDASRLTRVLFGALYLFPQLLAIMALLSWLVLGPLMLFGVMSWSWWLLIPLLSLLFFAPLPAPFRKKYELYGYKMSLFAENEFLKEAGVSSEDRLNYLKAMAERKNAHFTGANYYFMWPFGVEEDLLEAAEKIVSGQILKEDDIYGEIAAALQESK
jgi:hypothetical protein